LTGRLRRIRYSLEEADFPALLSAVQVRSNFGGFSRTTRAARAGL
jgi:hypothetical protein